MRRPLLPTLVLLAALAGCATVPAGRATLAPFRSDGCSLFPDGTPSRPDLWCDCCLTHDLAYWQGGTDDDRLAADRALRACVEARTDDPLLARLVYAGVRIGGPSVFPTWFRWGYGWPYGRGAKALGPAERAQVEEELQTYLRRNPRLSCAVDRGPPARSPSPGPSTRTPGLSAAPAARLAQAIGHACPVGACTKP
jgi:hypothetical protein